MAGTSRLAVPKRPALAALLLAGLFAAPALAATPTETVKAFYEKSLGLSPADPARFADPALTILKAADALRTSGEGECLDTAMPFDGVEAEPSTWLATLKLAEQVQGDQARVLVVFVVAGEPHRMEWKLAKAGDGWKVSDLLSITGEWALSQYQCQ